MDRAFHFDVTHVDWNCVVLILLLFDHAGDASVFDVPDRLVLGAMPVYAAIWASWGKPQQSPEEIGWFLGDVFITTLGMEINTSANRVAIE